MKKIKYPSDLKNIEKYGVDLSRGGLGRSAWEAVRGIMNTHAQGNTASVVKHRGHSLCLEAVREVKVGSQVCCGEARDY